MSFGPSFPDFTPDPTFSFATPYPRARLVPTRRRPSHSFSRSPSFSHALMRPGVVDTAIPIERPRIYSPTNPAAMEGDANRPARSRSPTRAATTIIQDQNQNTSDLLRHTQHRTSRSPEDRSVLLGRRQGSTSLGLRRLLAGMRPWGTDMTRADDELNDQESRLIQMDEGIRTFGRGFLLPPGCRQTVDEHEHQQASLSPSEQLSQTQLQEDQDATNGGGNNTTNGGGNGTTAQEDNARNIANGNGNRAGGGSGDEDDEQEDEEDEDGEDGDEGDDDDEEDVTDNHNHASHDPERGRRTGPASGGIHAGGPGSRPPGGSVEGGGRARTITGTARGTGARAPPVEVDLDADMEDMDVTGLETVNEGDTTEP